MASACSLVLQATAVEGHVHENKRGSCNAWNQKSKNHKTSKVLNFCCRLANKGPVAPCGAEEDVDWETST